MSVSRVAVCGSRSLPSGSVQLVSSVVGSLVSAGRSLSVGCASGVDAAAVSALVSRNACASLSVFAIGGQCGSGFAGRASAVAGVQAAYSSGASVSWWSGGAAAVPVQARLVSRSLACIGSASAVVAFVTTMPSQPWSGSGVWRSCGSGTWSSVAAAISRGSSAVVFPVGAAAGTALPQMPVPGEWVVAGGGIWSQAWRFVPAQAVLI